MTNQMRRNRKGQGGIFSERRSRVRKLKDRLTTRGVLVGRESGTDNPKIGNIHSRSISRQLKSQRNRNQ